MNDAPPPTAFPPDPEADLLASWDANAAAWTASVREGAIASRRAGTDAAIVEAVAQSGAKTALDVGCGEGWLARALAARGVDVTGVDGSAVLVAAAEARGGGRFLAVTYEALAANAGTLGGTLRAADLRAADPRFEAVVCNFALLGESVGGLLAALRTLTAPGGRLFVQTLHPLNLDGPYADGWRVETFAAFGGAYRAPMPWYARTVGGWVRVLRAAGWAVEDVREPIHPESGRPLSLLLVAAVKGA